MTSKQQVKRAPVYVITISWNDGSEVGSKVLSVTDTYETALAVSSISNAESLGWKRYYPAKPDDKFIAEWRNRFNDSILIQKFTVDGGTN